MDYLMTTYALGVAANLSVCAVFFVANSVKSEIKNTIILVLMLCFCLPFIPAISILMFGRNELCKLVKRHSVREK